mmetsp:Transcript_122382/g.345946  ORF Transcript_122382/g.345946 Transcript_122382/m.345946 type:complete len:327 (-) Transcript_122382:126-1106(-)
MPQLCGGATMAEERDIGIEHQERRWKCVADGPLFALSAFRHRCAERSPLSPFDHVRRLSRGPHNRRRLVRLPRPDQDRGVNRLQTRRHNRALHLRLHQAHCVNDARRRNRFLLCVSARRKWRACVHNAGWRNHHVKEPRTCCCNGVPSSRPRRVCYVKGPRAWPCVRSHHRVPRFRHFCTHQTKRHCARRHCLFRLCNNARMLSADWPTTFGRVDQRGHAAGQRAWRRRILHLSLYCHVHVDGRIHCDHRHGASSLSLYQLGHVSCQPFAFLDMAQLDRRRRFIDVLPHSRRWPREGRDRHGQRPKARRPHLARGWSSNADVFGVT